MNDKVCNVTNSLLPYRNYTKHTSWCTKNGKCKMIFDSYCLFTDYCQNANKNKIEGYKDKCHNATTVVISNKHKKKRSNCAGSQLCKITSLRGN